VLVLTFAPEHPNFAPERLKWTKMENDMFWKSDWLVVNENLPGTSTFQGAVATGAVVLLDVRSSGGPRRLVCLCVLAFWGTCGLARQRKRERYRRVLVDHVMVVTV
jgi:hypothetical protein